MRIGFFTDTYLPVTFGTEISIETFKNHLEKLGQEVFIFCPKFSKEIKEEKNVFRFPSIRLIKSPENRLMFFNFKDISKIVNLKLEIIHAHTPFSAGILAKIVAGKLKVPLFYTSHILYPEYAKYWLFKENKIFPNLMKFYLRIFGNSCSALIAPSYKMKRLLIDYGIKKPIFVCPTGIDFNKMEKVQEKDSELLRKYNLKEDSKILLYVGRLTKEKNVPFLLDAFLKIYQEEKNVYFVLIGEGNLLNELKEKVKKYKIESRVIFTGRIAWEEVIKFYRRSYLFLFASLTDTQGLIILEASYFGVPIVALKDDCYDQMLIDKKNGFTVYPFETKLFAEKVLTLLRNEKLHQEFSKNAKEIAKNFSAESQAKKLLEIYKNFKTKI
jgi:glycosyltransferase involved in cell wall biosynthesis